MRCTSGAGGGVGEGEEQLCGLSRGPPATPALSRALHLRPKQTLNNRLLPLRPTPSGRGRWLCFLVGLLQDKAVPTLDELREVCLLLVLVPGDEEAES